MRSRTILAPAWCSLGRVSFLPFLRLPTQHSCGECESTDRVDREARTGRKYQSVERALPTGLHKIRFSVDPASPAINGDVTLDDVLISGRRVHTQGKISGLKTTSLVGFFDNVDGLSHRIDLIRNPLFFSVDRLPSACRAVTCIAWRNQTLQTRPGTCTTPYP
jgi:hypothetical protein